ncbi:hypothetical protein GCM10025783_30270 [Amnibacterium soli]|uniref:Glyoxalase n=1 Tax=Amnibacterium soli TaxID=1282736 RepID=A0ABP8ZF55_9MICO
MSNIIDVVANVPVPDLESAIPVYQRLTGSAEVHRFTFREHAVARVGAFLLIEGPLEGWLGEQRATVLVTSVREIVDVMYEERGEVLEGPHPVPNALRLLVRHPDGTVMEYLEPQR